jgi:CO dehydrogenase maturation factor
MSLERDGPRTYADVMSDEGLKLAITGKGGVGKTTLTALLAACYAERGRAVLAIDADPSPCLGAAMGFPARSLDAISPIAEMDQLILERTGAEPGSYGGYFKLNPRVDDLPDRFSALRDGVKLLELGGVESGGSGCICPESTLLRALITHILLRRDEVVLLDMYAGVEHLGRATADAVDAMLVVVEPTLRSLGTADQIKDLARDIGLERIYLVGSKVRDDADRTFIEDNSPGLKVLGVLPEDDAVRTADRQGSPLYGASQNLDRASQAIIQALDIELAG